jgi:hypothetical protein
VKKKALRRWQQRVARVRARRFLWESFTSDHVRLKPWRALNQMGAYLMRDPGSWKHARSIVPSRIDSNRLLHLIEQGLDPDVVRRWPDYHKPYSYYW